MQVEIENDILKVLNVPRELANQVAYIIVNDLGVEEAKDLSLINEEDLTKGSILKTIQARKLIMTWKADKIEEQYNSTSSVETDSSHSLQPSPMQNWAMNFEIPWHKFPADLITSCNNNEVPTPFNRREMVKILIEEITKTYPKPGKRNLHTIACKVSSKYPNSFSDTFLHSDKINFGIQSLADQLLYRYEYVRRQTKRAIVSTPTSARKKLVESSLQHLNEAKLWLIDHYKLQAHDSSLVQYRMGETYELQREMIHNKTTIEQIKSEFPFLLIKEHLYDHFCTLMDKPDAVELFNSKLCSQAKKIFKALKSRSHAGIPAIARKIREECSEHGNSAPKALRIIDLLACYFKEDVKSVYQLFENEVELAEVLPSLQAAPIIIVFGDDLVTSEKFCVLIEQIEVMRCTDFFSAFVYMFCAFLCLK
uniref:uncharacterized protein LOC120329726 n=1 Tax=Styela clava TaxID=7725 RepID=UPI001939DB2B|nr:uncharacterized protein LOC120329726 [Styela clava]